MEIGDIVRYKNCSKGGELAIVTGFFARTFGKCYGKFVWVATGNKFSEDLEYLEVV
jgi:hypothetical protein